MDFSGSFTVETLFLMIALSVALTITLWTLISAPFVIVFILFILLDYAILLGLLCFLLLAISAILSEQLPTEQERATNKRYEEEPENTDRTSQTRPSSPILASLHGNGMSESENHSGGEIEDEADTTLKEGASDATSRTNIEIERQQQERQPNSPLQSDEQTPTKTEIPKGKPLPSTIPFQKFIDSKIEGKNNSKSPNLPFNLTDFESRSGANKNINNDNNNNNNNKNNKTPSPTRTTPEIQSTPFHSTFESHSKTPSPSSRTPSPNQVYPHTLDSSKSHFDVLPSIFSPIAEEEDEDIQTPNEIHFYNSGVEIGVNYFSEDEDQSSIAFYSTCYDILDQIFLIGLQNILANSDTFIGSIVELNNTPYIVNRCIQAQAYPFISIIFEVSNNNVDSILKISNDSRDLTHLLLFTKNNNPYTVKARDPVSIEYRNSFFHFFITEKGIPLSEYLRITPQSVTEGMKRSLVHQIILAVDSLHRLRIVHHNINFENIVIIGDSLKLQGFDYASNNKTETLKWPVEEFQFGFLPPELNVLSRTNFFKFDIFAVSSVIYHLFYKTSPYHKYHLNSYSDVFEFGRLPTHRFVFHKFERDLSKNFPSPIVEAIVAGLHWYFTHRISSFSSIVHLCK